MHLLFQKMHHISVLSAYQMNKHFLCLHPYQEKRLSHILSSVVLNVTPDWTANIILSGLQAL